MEIKFTHKQDFTEYFPNDMGLKFMAHFYGFDRDWLFRTCRFEMRNSLRALGGVDISPFPDCCGFRIIHKSYLNVFITELVQKLWFSFVKDMISWDNYFNHPGTYLFAYPGIDYEQDEFEEYDSSSTRIFSELQNYASTHIDQKNYVMSNLNRLGIITIPKDGFPNFICRKELQQITPY